MKKILEKLKLGRTEEEKAPEEIAQKADDINFVRRLIVLNTRNNKVIFELVGELMFSFRNMSCQLEVSCKAGGIGNRKYLIGLNPDTTYIVEDLGGVKASDYSYEENFFPEKICQFYSVLKPKSWEEARERSRKMFS